MVFPREAISLQMNIHKVETTQLDSFDALYKSVLFKNNNLVIPYINLGVVNNPLNGNKNELRYMSYCYIVCKNVSYLKVF